MQQGAPTPSTPGWNREDWRGKLRRGIGWMLLAKLAALIVLRSLFFSGEQRVDVTPGTVEAKLSLQARVVGANPVSREAQHD
jgi:hypothetical protein